MSNEGAASALAELAVRRDPGQEVRYATVVTAGDSVTVLLDGAETASPASCAMAVHEGDRVTVSTAGRRVTVTGNITAPATDDAAAEAAREVADGAALVAEATNQHFWTDDSGVHVTQETQEDFLDNPTGANQLSNSNGILLRDGESNMAAFTPSAVSFFDGQGNQAANVTAVFGSDGATIGKASSDHVEVGTDSLKVLDSSDYAYFVAGDITDSNGIVRLSELARGNGANLELTVSYPIHSVYTTTVWGTGDGTSDGWQFSVASVSGNKVTLSQQSPIYLPESAVFRVEYATSQYDQAKVLSFGEQRGRSYFGAFGVDYEGNVRAASVDADAMGVKGYGVLTTKQATFGADAAFYPPTQVNGVYNRFVMTSFGNIRHDTSTDGTSWTTKRYFIGQYVSGDSFTVNINTSGYCTSSMTHIRFAVPLQKGAVNGLGVTVTSVGTVTVRSVGGYSHGSSASAGVAPSAVTATLREGWVDIDMTMGSTTNATNNTPVGVSVSGMVLTFA